MNLPKHILNHGLLLSMEFGENWLVEINERLSKKHPELTQSEINHCSKLCKKVNTIAHGFIANKPAKSGEEFQFIDFSDFQHFIRTTFHWIDEENLKKLYSQSCYYARK